MFAVIKTSLRELVIIIVQRKKDQRYGQNYQIIIWLWRIKQTKHDYCDICYVHVNFFWDFSMYNYIMHIQWYSKDA